jgi:hypothetical protein
MIHELASLEWIVRCFRRQKQGSFSEKHDRAEIHTPVVVLPASARWGHQGHPGWFVLVDRDDVRRPTPLRAGWIGLDLSSDRHLWAGRGLVGGAARPGLAFPA